MYRIRFGLITFTLLALTNTARAQSYKTAAGIRIDNGLHLTVQQYITDGWTAEGILHSGVGSRNLGVTLLAEKHNKLIFRNLNIYFGIGGHYYWENEPRGTETTVAKDVYGVSGIGGAELSLGRFNISLDWKPELHVSESTEMFGWNGASVSLRYVFAKRERKKIKDWKIWGGDKDKDKGKDKDKDKKNSKDKRNKYD